MTTCVLHLQYKASDWGFKENLNKEQILWFLQRTSLRCRVCKLFAELCWGCWTWHWIRKSPLLVLDYIKKNTQKKNTQKCQNHLRTPQCPLSLSHSLSEGQFTFILPLFKLLTFHFSWFLFWSSCVSFMNLHCWQEKSPVFDDKMNFTPCVDLDRVPVVF